MQGLVLQGNASTAWHRSSICGVLVSSQPSFGLSILEYLLTVLYDTRLLLGGIWIFGGLWNIAELFSMHKTLCLCKLLLCFVPLKGSLFSTGWNSKSIGDDQHWKDEVHFVLDKINCFGHHSLNKFESKLVSIYFHTSLSIISSSNFRHISYGMGLVIKSFNSERQQAITYSRYHMEIKYIEYKMFYTFYHNVASWNP